MPKTRQRKTKQIKKVGASISDRRNISEAFQRKMIEYSEKPLEELEAIGKAQKAKEQKSFGGSYQKAFEFAIEMKRKTPKETGESEKIELDGMSAEITPVEMEETV